MGLKLIVKSHFDAAHRLENYNGKCANMHGHRWEVEVEIPIDPEKYMRKSDGRYFRGVTVDFSLAKGMLEEALPDHRVINEVWPINPTAENIAMYLLRDLGALMGVTRVRVWESPECSAEASADVA